MSNRLPDGRGMAKQITDPTDPTTAARDAFARLEAKLPELRTKRDSLVAEMVPIERVSKAGVPAVMAMEPPDAAKDVEAPAYALLNGAAIAPMFSKKGNDGVRLYALQREIQIIDRAIVIAEGQLRTATLAASREAAAEGLDQTRALHRQRALVLISLLELNDKIEAHRVNSAVGGISADGPMEGFTARLFGTAANPSPLNHWPRRYIAACLAAGVITKKELNQ
jgi:hypothetical protein